MLYISVTDTAKAVRAALKERFPSTKFSVRSNSYAGGASINVKWFDGPNESDVKDVTDQFEGATFDGMIDLKSYKIGTLSTGEPCHWGADFIFERREFSPAVHDAAAEFTADAIRAEGYEGDVERFYGDCPQAFLRSRVDSDRLGWEQDWYSLVRVASSWIVEGRAMSVRVSA